MKRNVTKRIIIVALAVLLMSLCATAAVLAADTTETKAYGEKLSGYQVSTNGKVNLRFVYSDLGTGMDAYKAEIYEPDGVTSTGVSYTYEIGKITNKTIVVPLAPSEMANIVKVYPVTLSGDTVTEQGEAVSYSVREYALAVLGRNDLSSYHSSMRALLNWGAMAEKTFDNTAIPKANEGLYTRNTNPINGVTKSFAAEDASITYKKNDAYGCTLKMEIGRDTSALNFYFTGLSDGNYTATVSKAGGAAVNAGAVTKNGDSYKVSIQNVGVKVYDKIYTVTLKDSSGDLITAQASVLGYLDSLAFDTGENANFNDIAKSMYQFYILAMNKSVDNCDHLEAHWEKNDADTSYIVCSKCFAKIDGRAVNDNVNWYANIAEIAGNSAAAADGVGVQNENGVSYKGFNSASGGIIFLTKEKPFASTFTSESFTTGNYIVVKYRTGKEAGLKLAGGTTADKRNDFGILSASNQTDTWKVSVIDATKVEKWTAAENQIAELRFLVQGAMTVDVAMVAVVDNKVEVATLLSEEETYFMHDATFTTKGLELNKTGTCASGCTYSESKSAGVYTYSCSACKDTVKREVPSGVGYFANIVDKTSFAGAGVTVSVKKDEKGGFLYKSYSAATAGAGPILTADAKDWGTRAKETLTEGERLGQYLVIKYKTTGAPTGGGTKFQICSGSNGKVNIQLSGTTVPTEWTVEIIDLSAASMSAMYSASDTSIYMAFYLNPANATIDVAYAAIADDLDSARALIDDGDTYRIRTVSGTSGERTTSVSGMFNKDGTCPENGCAIALENIEGGIKYVCNNCGTVFETRTIPKTVSAYKTPDTITSKYNNQGATVTNNLMAENGVVFQRFVSAPEKSSSTALTLISNQEVVGEYVVLKYRTNCSSEKTKMTFSVRSNTTGHSYTTGNISYLNQPTEGLWLTGYISLAGTAVAGELIAGNQTTVTLTMVHDGDGSKYTVDIAFVAIVSSLTDAEALVSAGDTLTEGIQDTNWTVSQFNKDLEPLIKDKAANELQFIHFADVHRSLTPWNRVVGYYNEYSQYIDFAVHAGDYVGAYNSTQDGNYNDLYTIGTQSTKPIYNVAGNHDYYKVAGGSEKLDKAEVINTLFNKTDDWNVTYKDGEAVNTSYYRDFPEQKVRFIVLDNYYDEAGQVEWLQGLLTEAKTLGYHVLTSMHEPTAKIVTPLDTSFHCSIEQTSSFRTSLFDQVIGDFIADGGSFIANLTGHWHVDFAGYSENGVLNITVEIASAGAVGAEQLDGRPQLQGERGYDAFNVINVNTETGVLEIVRIGNNSDSIGREKTSLKFDYLKGTIISEN